MLWIRSGIEILRSRRSLAVVAGMKKRLTTQNRQKSNDKKPTNPAGSIVSLLMQLLFKVIPNLLDSVH